MFRTLLNVFLEFIQNILVMFHLSSALVEGKSNENKLQVYIKTNSGEQVSVELDQSWTVEKIKNDIAPKLKCSSGELKIIFAGKELPNDLNINQCDLGNHSILHAVKIVRKDTQNVTVKGENIANLLNGTVETKSISKLDHCLLNEDNFNTFGNTSKPSEASSSGSSDAISQSMNKVCISSKNRLLCDASTVLTIQLSDEEQRLIKELKAQDNGGERPNFYVYCVNPCGWVRVGKLRVRCRHCKQGAVIVHRDPASWDDVLNPGQINATCESGCGETEAEFYFKCRDHETLGESDTSVPLYLVRANLPRVPCLACTDVSSPIIVFQCTSAHVMCLDCFVTYCISRLSERQFVYNDILGYTLACPAGCENSLIKEVHHFKLMGDHHYNRYQHWSTEEAVLAAGGVLCPYPGCGQGLLPDEDCRRITCVGGCGYVFCRDCLQGFHIGECESSVFEDELNVEGGSFHVDPSRAAQSRFDEASNLTIKIMTKPCPKCRTPTERSGGCMHMVCTRGSCGFHWCWVCQTEWTRECMSAHWFG